MNMQAHATFLNISLHRMFDHYLPKLTASIRAVDREHLWRREGENLNAIGGIVLHICEHVRRNAIFLTSRDTRFPAGIEEHFPDLLLSPEELSARVEQTFSEWQTAMKTRIAQTLSDARTGDIDPVTEMHRVYHLVEHTGYHLGQIVDRVKRITGRSFRFTQEGLNERRLREIIETSPLK